MRPFTYRDGIPAALGIIGWLLLGYGASLAADLLGVATVVDGDTIEIHGTRVRIFGIDAPESSQLCRDGNSLLYRCGAKAANELDAFLNHRSIICMPVNRDRYGRTVATCSAGTFDVGGWLVRHGHALDWPKYSRGRYTGAQVDAQHAEAGIWSGSFAWPWQYRDCMKAAHDISVCSDL
jgi:endonuclease YncB( thermonuclease family)